MLLGLEVVALALTLAAADPYATPATRDPELGVGHRLRVDYLRREPGSQPGVTLLRPVRRAGEIVAMDSVSLDLAIQPQSSALRIPYADIEGLALSEGISKPRGIVNGALIGAAVAGLTALFFNAATFDRDDPDSDEFHLLGIALSATAGGLVGGVYGNVHGRESWRAIPVRTLWASD